MLAYSYALQHEYIKRRSMNTTLSLESILRDSHYFGGREIKYRFDDEK